MPDEVFYKQDQWVEASTGCGIFSRTPTDGRGDSNGRSSKILGPTTFVGQGNLNVLSDHGPVVVPFEFAIPGESVAEAFANSQAAFEAAKDAKVREIDAAKERQARQLVLPSGQVIPKSNGHPRTR
jgi:hypothetical protein